MRDNLFVSKILPWLVLAAVLLWPVVILARTIPYKQALAIRHAEAVQTRPRYWGVGLLGMPGAAGGATRHEAIIRNGCLARYGYTVQTPH